MSAIKIKINKKKSTQVKKRHSRKFQIIQTQSGLIVDISKAISGSVHDFRIFKEHLFNKQLDRLLKSMEKVLVWGDTAYEALVKIFPHWTSFINERAKRNHPLTEEQKIKNRYKSKTRILVEHTLARIKKYRCCLERVRNMKATKQAQYWNIVAGICNLRKANKIGLNQLFGYP